MRRLGLRWRASVLAVVVAVAVLGGIAALSPGSSHPRPGEPRLVGRTSGRSMLAFSLVLRLPDRQRLSRFIDALYDPRSPAYHHFIDAKTFGARFGVSSGVLRSTTRMLAGDGVQVVAEYPQRTALDARAPAALVERLFGVRMMDYLAADGRRFHAPATTPVVPAGLREAVSAVAGLDGRYPAVAQDVPRGGLGPADAAAVYDLSPLYKQGIQGQGEKVGILSFAGYNQSDLDGFAQQYGLPPLKPQDVSPSDVGPATDHGSEGAGEVELDLEMVHGIAPQAQIFNYNAPDTNASGAYTLGDMIDRIVADGQVKIVSDSWGGCEQLFPNADIQRSEQAIAAALAHGISIFVASGDSGAYTCQRFRASDHDLSAGYPASSPGVISVGGTSLSVGQNGGYAGETPWAGALEQTGGGGAPSILFPRPSWQHGVIGLDNRFSNGKRQVPDVSAAADPFTGWSVYEGGQLTAIGGTSAASPFWASSMALIDQYAHQHGSGALGFVNPMLYGIASSAQPVPPLHDITTGTNRYYPATVGWDFATGLGSPDVYNLAQDVVRYMKSHGH